jgi:hypothetical protein
MPATGRAQLHICGRNSLSAFAAAKTGHAEIATMMAKSSASMVNSRVFSRTRLDRVSSRNNWRFLIADLCARVCLIIVRFTGIAVITGPLVKAETLRVRLRIVKRRLRLSNEMFGMMRFEAVVVGRLCQTPRRLTETPYNFTYSPRFALAVLNRSSGLLRVRSGRASGN